MVAESKSRKAGPVARWLAGLACLVLLVLAVLLFPLFPLDAFRTRQFRSRVREMSHNSEHWESPFL